MNRAAFLGGRFDWWQPPTTKQMMSKATEEATGAPLDAPRRSYKNEWWGTRGRRHL